MSVWNAMDNDLVQNEMLINIRIKLKTKSFFVFDGVCGLQKQVGFI